MVDTNLVIQLLINGLIFGAIYALISLGLSLIWGVSRIINLAHGEFIIIGAYVTYFMYKSFGGNPFFYLPLSGLIVGIIGIILQYALYNRLLGKEILLTLILSFGVGLVLSSLMTLFFTGDFRALNTEYAISSYSVGSFIIIKGDLYAFLIAIAVFLITYLLLEKTTTGRAIRAVAQNREAALLMGIDDKQIYIIAMFISAFLAGFSGGIVAILYSFYPTVGNTYLGWSFAITILAGLGTIQGVLIAGLIVGVTRDMTTLFAQGLEPSIGFLIMIIVILIRPKGLFGRGVE